MDELELWDPDDPAWARSSWKPAELATAGPLRVRCDKCDAITDVGASAASDGLHKGGLRVRCPCGNVINASTAQLGEAMANGAAPDGFDEYRAERVRDGEPLPGASAAATYDWKGHRLVQSGDPDLFGWNGRSRR